MSASLTLGHSNLPKPSDVWGIRHTGLLITGIATGAVGVSLHSRGVLAVSVELASRARGAGSVILGVVVANCSGDSLPIGKPGAMGIRSEYHLIDLATGLSHGGFQSLQAARQHAREEDLIAWDVFRGNEHVERHDPRADRIS